MTGAAGGGPDTAGTCRQPIWDGPYKFTCGRNLIDGKCSRHGPQSGGGPDTAGIDPDLIEAMVTAAEDWMHADPTTFNALDTYDRERIARHIAPRMLAAVRAHQNTTDRQAAARALRDAADAWDPNGLDDIRDWLRNRADNLDADEDDDHTTVPRCQHISPSPWGPTQCVLPDGHDGRHAYDPSET